ncbi:hypothetical protein [Mesorhizobium loti]|uniref:Uncharacterized protein n=1 Tax=Mesorhizobium loti R88b TaxID=935548 RepID=A0A6M7WJD7_RHILI|nr:hypothetical protein [Mesorhizobium loti]QKD02227.1 hypothetical protein EB235_12550 [Mesorhizobium loti R88b]
MSDSETTAPAHTLYRGTTVVLVNVVAWFLAFLLQHFAPEEIVAAVSGAVVLSGAIGGALALTNSRRQSALTAMAGLVSTILSLCLFVPLTGFRLGMAVGGVGTAFDAILCFTVIYTLMFLFIFAVEFAANWLTQRRRMRKAEHD